MRSARVHLTPAGSGRVPLSIHRLIESFLPRRTDNPITMRFIDRTAVRWHALLEAARKIPHNGRGSPLYPVWCLVRGDQFDAGVLAELDKWSEDPGADELLNVAAALELLDMRVPLPEPERWPVRPPKGGVRTRAQVEEQLGTTRRGR